MFFVMNLVKNLLITPDKLGPNLSNHIRELLKRTVEGSCNSRYGSIIAVLMIDAIGEGMVQDTSGDVLYPVKYKAIVFMPYVGEVIDVIVNETTELGFFGGAGPLKLCVARENMFREYQFDNKGSTPSWVSENDAALRIERNSSCRVKL